MNPKRLLSSHRDQADLSSLVWHPMIIGEIPLKGLEYAALASNSNRRGYWMKMEPGSHSPLHRHTDEELIVIWDGEVQDSDNRQFKTGSSLVYAAGSEHYLYSPSGCVMLVIESAPAEILP